MSYPDAKHHNPDPDYLRTLIEKAGYGHREVARQLGVSERAMRAYLADRDKKSALECPYTVQYCLERLADAEKTFATPAKIA